VHSNCSELRAKSKHLQNYAHKSFNTFPSAWTLDNPLLGLHLPRGAPSN